MKKIISLLLALAVMFSLSLTGTAAFAAEIKYSDIVIGDGELSETGENAASDNAKVIQAAFDEAKNKASDKNRYRIYFPKGEYHINTTLNIFSNTELYLDEKTTLVQDAPKGQNIVKAGDFSQKHILYNGFRNIKIDGGKWDMQFNGSCAMRFGHCTNLSINNVNITNILDAHHIEAAAVDTLSITDSTFTSSWRKGSNSCEAIQLDILHDSKHFPGFEEFDDTPNKNVTISGCTFSNLHSGIGTRSAVVSKYFDNVVIENNKFENIQEKAISCFNYKNSKIINNTFTNVNSGICFEYLPNNFFGAYSQRMYIANDKSIGKINSKSSTVISGNVMNIKQMAKSSYGIYAYGAKVDASTAKANGIVAGDYTISDLSIDNNTINVEEKSPKSYGIYITGVNKSEISSNTLTDYSSAENGINGINICASQKNDIKNNNISGTFNNGISIFNKPFPGSKNLLITSNSISGVKSYGIRVAESSFATIKSDNNISAGESPLCLYSQNYSQNVPTPSVKSKGYSLRNKPLIRFSSLNGSAGYKVSRSAYNGTFKEIATVYGENLNFEDKSSTAFSKNYYRVTPIYNVGGTVVTGKNYIDIAF
ncbi:MAG: right-handed parallel beta-helix repeat-containing protein [Eubacterium sp.]|nr:right-handed parallel beta-helix repeat-containing protein [Eubacterium sp.]